MKRPIAMLLALLLTAGLFAFSGCEEKKNYTVEVVEERSWKYRLHFFEDDIKRFNKDLEEQDWAVFEIKGWDDSLFVDYIDGAFGEPDTISDIFQFTDIVAKCHLVDCYRPLYYTKYKYEYQSRHGETIASYGYPLGRVYTFAVEEILYQSDAINYKKNDRIDVWIWDYTVPWGDLDRGMAFKLKKSMIPPETSSFYVCLSVPKITSLVKHDLRVEIISSVADMMLPRDYPFIVPLGNNVYEFGHDFFEEFFGDIHWGDYYVQVEDRITVGLPLRAEIENFEEKLMAIIEKYKP